MSTSGYCIRRATGADADAIVRHRVAMFRAMGILDQRDAGTLVPFAIDVPACAGCGGHLRLLLATIEDPATVAKIFAHLGLPTELPALTPARSPPQQDGFDFT